ncbi:MAG: porin, partial [Ferruginibacter sp.]
MTKKAFLFILASFCCINTLFSQFLMDLVDTTTDMGKGMLNMYKELGNIHIGGYIQPQFQLAQSKGA